MQQPLQARRRADRHCEGNSSQRWGLQPASPLRLPSAMRSEFLSDSGLVLPSATQCLRMQCRLDCSLRTCQTGMGCTMCCLHPQHQSHMTHTSMTQAEGGAGHLSQQQPCRSHTAHKRQPTTAQDEDSQSQQGRQYTVPAPRSPSMCLSDQEHKNMRSKMLTSCDDAAAGISWAACFAWGAAASCPVYVCPRKASRRSCRRR